LTGATQSIVACRAPISAVAVARKLVIQPA
jgi:hypothetical protein